MLDRVIEALRRHGGDRDGGPTATQVADALWLYALRVAMPASAEAEARAAPPTPSAEEPGRPERPGPAPTPEPADKPQPRQPPPGQAGSRGAHRAPNDARVGVHVPPSRPEASAGSGRRAVPIRSPRARALPGPLELARALRPLTRRVDSPFERVLDLTETVRRAAEQRIWIPVLRPAPARWLDVALVLDAAPSMAAWWRAAHEFLSVLASTGAFRDVRLWRLETTAPVAEPPLVSGRSIQRRPARTLVDAAGRRLILILSDGAASCWHDGRMRRLVAIWGRGQPVALVQVLPQTLWSQTGLGAALPLRVRATAPGCPNSRLVSDPGDGALWGDLDQTDPDLSSTPLPVTTLDPKYLARWAAMLGQGGPEPVPAFVLAASDPLAGQDHPGRRRGGAVSGADRVRRFESLASPETLELARLLSATRLRLPLMRLVQEQMVPRSGLLHLAEFLLGGLVRRADRDDVLAADPDLIEFEFHDGVHDALFATTLIPDAVRVFDLASRYLAERFGYPIDFQTLVETPEGPGATELAHGDAPFAAIATMLLRRLGGPYAQIASRFEGRRDPDASLEADGGNSSEELVRILVVLTGHLGGVNSVAFSPDGRRLASSGSEGIVRLWDLGSGNEVATLWHESTSVAFGPDGRRLASGGRDGTVRLWDIDSGREVATLWHGAWVDSIAFGPDGRRLASGGDDGMVRLWDADSGDKVDTLQHGTLVLSVKFSPDGHRLASGGGETVRLWDADSGREVATLRHGACVLSVAFGPDGRRLASACGEGAVRLWDADSGREVATLWHGAWVNSVAFSPDGRRLASSGNDGTVRLWDAASGRVVATLEREELVRSVAFSPDGLRLASGGNDGTVRLRDISRLVREAMPMDRGIEESSTGIDASQTRAVVVGIERYDLPGMDLDGRTRDACRFVRWLRRSGVPADQIALFASPLVVNEPLLADLDVLAQPARRDSIRGYFTLTLPALSANLFFLFWGGRGLLTSESKRRLILADASPQDVLNLDLDSLLDSLHGDLFPGLPRQVVFIDACANHVEHLRPAETFPLKHRLDVSRQFVLFGADAGQVVKNDGEIRSGVFSSALLDDLERQPDRLFPPDLPSLARRLVARFRELREAGRVDQTPATFQEQDWTGDVRRFGDIPLPADRTHAGRIPVDADSIEPTRRWELCDALLDCAVISDNGRRPALLHYLRPEIRARLQDHSAARTQVMEIVRICLEHPGGIEELAEIVRAWEGDSHAMRRIDEWIEHNLPRR